MAVVEQIIGSIKEINEALDDPGLEPDLERSDWSAHRATVDSLKGRLAQEVIEPLKDALSQLEQAEEREALRTHAALVVADTAALLLASRQATEGNDLLKRGLAIAPPGPFKEELQAATRDGRNWLALVRARWLMAQDRRDEADKLAKSVMAITREPRLKASAEEVVNAPRPITSAPTLFTLNGFGLGIYGERDRQEDGTYIATHCICALFIPIFPLAAYRVLPQGDNSYLFLARERLSGFARGYRNLLLAGIVAAIGLGVTRSYLNSPSRRAAIEVAEAQALEEEGKHDEAIETYENALGRWEWSASRSTMQEAGLGLARLYSEDVPEPMTLAGVERAARAVTRWQSLPDKGRGGKAATFMTGRIQGWVDDIGSESPEATRGCIRLLGMAEEIAEGRARSEVEQQKGELQMALADLMATAWPLAALATYAGMDDDEALTKAGAILDNLGERHALWIEAAASAHAFVEKTGNKGILQEAAARVHKRLAAAQKAQAAPARQRALRTNSIKVLSAWLKKAPGDQQAAVALARLRRDTGKTRAALATMESLGEPGWLVAEAQLMLGTLYADLGELEKAEAVLEPYLARRLPAFRQARQDYQARSESVRERIVNRAERGDMPAELEAKLPTATEQERQALFVGWLTREFDSDAELEKLKARYETFVDVAPASLTLGMVKLRRANVTSGDAREALLVDAERVFLSIRDEAEGLPAYHLGLGQVYHRLGRPEEGDKELEIVLAEADPALELAVASTYRELGQIARARQLADKVWRSGDKPHAGEAATIMAMMANDLDEEETWFQRADQSLPFVKRGLQRVEGERLFRAGKFKEAERIFAKVARGYAKEIKHNPAAANNAAIMHQYRYMCVGESELLSEAIAGLEAAMRLAPDNALVIGNLAGTYDYAGTVGVLALWVDPKLVRVDRSDASTLLGALSQGPLASLVVAAATKEPSLGRSAELTKQEAILAPNRSGPYTREASWYALRRDTEALHALRERLGRVTGFDTSQAEHLREIYQNREDDQRFLTLLDAALARLDLQLVMAKKQNHARSMAALYYLRGLRLRERAELTDSIEDAEAAVAAFREANRGWPQLDTSRIVAGALTEAAILKAARSSKPVADYWRANIRVYSLAIFLHRIAADPNGAEIVAAIRKEKEIREAATLRKASMGARPTITDWALARLVGDAGLEATAAQVFEQEDERIEAEIKALLDPGSQSAKALAELMATSR